MNGRVYDPVLARFLGPDPYVQAPDYTQNFNRYSYCYNNPFKYTDPSGEWIHLLIGAIIGGTVNLVSNLLSGNVHNFWQGLGYFGVGAVAGALGAGIGAGISSALPITGQVSGGFAAGFMGTSSATTATTSFVSGALIGSGAGLSSGFVSGFGNGLLQGQNFGQALWNGTKTGLIAGASGFAIGGIWGGISAVRDGRDFLEGSKVINKQVLADAKLPAVTQNNNMNCGPSTAESNTGISQNAYRNDLVTNYKYGINDPVNPSDLNKSITNLTGRVVKPFTTELPTDLTGAKQVSTLLNNGNRFILSSGTGTSINHATALNKITVVTIQKISGSTIQKIVYQVMNPASGTFENIGAKSMDLIWRIFP